MLAFIERRKATRYRFYLPAVFTCQDAEGITPHGYGFTRDMSAAGAFIETGTPLPVGADVQLEICLPATDRTAHPRMVGEGRVVRFEETTQHGGSGFAVACTVLSLDHD